MFQDIKNTWFIKSAFILICLLLSSCSVLNSASKKSGENTQKIEFLVLTSPFINPDVVDRAAPVRIDVFQLARKSNFIYSSYLDLIDEDNALKDDALATTQYMLVPDSINSIPLDIMKNSDYLGVIAGYREIEDANWKLVLQKQPPKRGSRTSYLYVKVNESGIFQLSKKQMKAELKEYAKRHPDDKTVTKNGDFKKPKYDYSKGVFNAN